MTPSISAHLSDTVRGVHLSAQRGPPLLPEQISLADGGMLIGTLIAKLMFDHLRFPVNGQRLDSFTASLGVALSLSPAEVTRLVKTVLGWAQGLPQNTTLAVAGLVRVVYQALPAQARKRVPALSAMERSITQGENEARKILERLRKALPDLSGKTLPDKLQNEAAEMAAAGKYWTAFALEQLARGFKPGRSSSSTVVSKGKADTPPFGAPGPRYRGGWAASKGPFAQVKLDDIRALKDAPLEWPEGSRLPMSPALRRLIAAADALVTQGKLEKLTHNGISSHIYLDPLSGTLYRISEVSEDEIRANLRASRVKPPIGPQVDLNQSLFVPLGIVGHGKSVRGPAVLALENLGGPTLDKAISSSTSQQQLKVFLGLAADVMARVHLLFIHGDVHAGNLVFDIDKKRLFLIDFQMSSPNRQGSEGDALRLVNDLRPLLRLFKTSLVDTGGWTEAKLVGEFKRRYFQSIDQKARLSHPPATHPGLRRAMDAAFDQLEKEGVDLPWFR
jgi:hypothetical protein